jgi:hypothetical protein
MLLSASLGMEEERGAYGTFTPDVLRAPPVQSFYTSSFHRDDVFSGRAVDDSRPASAAKIAVQSGAACCWTSS